jgi:iron-sulfur cluster repair protein YtfE (RIC family)
MRKSNCAYRSAFEADLHEHIHLENNILFPRSIQMEEGAF